MLGWPDSERDSEPFAALDCDNRAGERPHVERANLFAMRDVRVTDAGYESRDGFDVGSDRYLNKAMARVIGL